MGKFDGIIIASDIDGTFLGKKGRMVPENLEAIEYFKKEGGCFTIATGREYCLLPQSILAMPDLCNIPLVACTGAYICNLATGEVVSEEVLPEPEVSAIADAARRYFPHISMRIACGGKQMTDQDTPENRDVMARYPDVIEIRPYEDIPRGAWSQITWHGAPAEMIKLRKVVEEHITGGCFCTATEPSIMTLNSVNATKGTAIRKLKTLIGMENATLWAIGDYENDIAMLKMADRCATPENGLDSLKEIPGMVVVRDHDKGAIAGLIEYIEKHLTENGKEQ